MNQRILNDGVSRKALNVPPTFSDTQDHSDGVCKRLRLFLRITITQVSSIAFTVLRQIFAFTILRIISSERSRLAADFARITIHSGSF